MSGYKRVVRSSEKDGLKTTQHGISAIPCWQFGGGSSDGGGIDAEYWYRQEFIREGWTETAIILCKLNKSM